MPSNDSTRLPAGPALTGQTVDNPSIVITLPFDPRVVPKNEIDAALKDALSRAVRQLMAAYPRDIVIPVVNKLEDMAGNLNYATQKRSVAIFVSPHTEKVLYLDEALDEHILVNNGFRIRDLTVPNTSNVQYYILLLSGHLSKMYRGDNYHLQLIKTNVLRDTENYGREEYDTVEPRNGRGARKQDILGKFLCHMDEGLTVILYGHPLPVFILAARPVAENFSRITCNDWHIASCIHQCCPDTSEEDLLEILQPYLHDWPNIRHQMTLKHLAIAEEAGKLDSGIEQVTKDVCTGNNRLLIVERGYNERANPSYIAGSAAEEKPTRFYVRDQADAIIEKVLERGGQVEWVDEGRLPNREHIALVRYY